MRSIQDCHRKAFGNLPEKVLQFGEGNFLRAFVDWMVEESNRRGFLNGSVVLCQPIARGMAGVLNAQRCQYTVLMRGMENGVPVERAERISSVSRCINPYEDYDALLAIARSEALAVLVSNTTEAGIAYHAGDQLTARPPAGFPAKLCAFLYERYRAFDGDMNRGLLVLPVELIDNNGAELKRIVLRHASEWELGEAFADWVNHACEFASTLVDRIVTGYPGDEAEALWEKLGYIDHALVTCEIFYQWVIQADQKWADVFPAHRAAANVIWTDDVTPYKKRKVRMLNGAHTATVPAAFLAGHTTVLDFMNDPAFRGYLNALLLDEVVPTLDLPRADLLAFARAVNDRFANPFIRHRLLDISLNSCSKFNARCLPSLLAYQEARGILPKRLTFALAAFILFYRGRWEDGKLMGTRADGTRYEIRDDLAVMDFFAKAWAGGADAAAGAALGNAGFWGGRDLTRVPGLEQAVAGYLRAMLASGVAAALKAL